MTHVQLPASSIFQAYDDEYSSLTSTIEKEMALLKSHVQGNNGSSNITNPIQTGTSGDSNNNASTSNSGSSSSSERMVEALLTQSLDLIKQMEMEVRSQEGVVRRQLSDKVTSYRTTLKQQQAEFLHIKEQSDKAHLMELGQGGIGGRGNGALTQQNNRLLGVHDKLYRQNEAITNAQRSVFETEEVGAEIVDELQRNREKIESSQDRMREFSGTADSARRMILSMQRRETQHKCLMYSLLAALLLALLGGIYYSWTG